jgi:hypothetical protein
MNSMRRESWSQHEHKKSPAASGIKCGVAAEQNYETVILSLHDEYNKGKPADRQGHKKPPASILETERRLRKENGFAGLYASVEYKGK